jgi:hypothetical protein
LIQLKNNLQLEYDSLRAQSRHNGVISQVSTETIETQTDFKLTPYPLNFPRNVFYNYPIVSIWPKQSALKLLQSEIVDVFQRTDVLEQNALISGKLSTKSRIANLTNEIRNLQTILQSRGKVIDESKKTIEKLEKLLQDQRLSFQAKIKKIEFNLISMLKNVYKAHYSQTRI